MHAGLSWQQMLDLIYHSAICNQVGIIFTNVPHSEPTSHCSFSSSMLSSDATNTNFIVFGSTRPGLEPTIYHTQGDHWELEHQRTCKSLALLTAWFKWQTNIHQGLNGFNNISELCIVAVIFIGGRNQSTCSKSLLSHNVVLSTPLHEQYSNSQL